MSLLSSCRNELYTHSLYHIYFIDQGSDRQNLSGRKIGRLPKAPATGQLSWRSHPLLTSYFLRCKIIWVVHDSDTVSAVLELSLIVKSWLHPFLASLLTPFLSSSTFPKIKVKLCVPLTDPPQGPSISFLLSLSSYPDKDKSWYVWYEMTDPARYPNALFTCSSHHVLSYSRTYSFPFANSNTSFQFSISPARHPL